MTMQLWRPGDYRLCPSCRTRHKVQDVKCDRCGTVLVGRPVQRATAAPVAMAGAGSSRPVRILLALGLVLAIGAGLWMRNLFRGAPLQDSVEASAPGAPAPAPTAPPTWTPPVLSYPPVVGYNRGVPSSMAGLAVGGPPVAPAEPPPSGMVSIAPPTQPFGRTAFTNEDLERTRVAGVAVSSPPANAPARAGAPSADEAQDWTSRVRDDEDKVQDAQARVRRLQAQVESLRGEAATVPYDAEARQRIQRDLVDTLDDLEKAERKLSEKQRDLADTRERARAAGVRL